MERELWRWEEQPRTFVEMLVFAKCNFVLEIYISRTLCRSRC
jgi:hypothetical protein